LFLTDCVSSDNACDAANTPSAGYSFNQGAATPEPSSVAILGAGLLGLGYFGRRRVRLAKA
jgi:threonine dehydrogenase-like Zn-dependent dehydrogenase